MMTTTGSDESAERRAAFEAALNNEYFVLQSSRSTTVSESGSRATLYVMSLSSTLVAIGFVAQSRSGLGPLLAVVLPTLFVLGLFTVIRLVDTGVANLSCLRSMELIRRHYAELVPEGSAFFVGASVLESTAVRRGRRVGLFTIATMIAVLNTVVGSTGIALLIADLRGGFDQGYVGPIGVGLAVGIVLIAAFLFYQHRRYQALA
jgi:hypothetical protein